MPPEWFWIVSAAAATFVVGDFALRRWSVRNGGEQKSLVGPLLDFLSWFIPW
jgi:hypothetical protein